MWGLHAHGSGSPVGATTIPTRTAEDDRLFCWEIYIDRLGTLALQSAVAEFFPKPTLRMAMHLLNQESRAINLLLIVILLLYPRPLIH